MEVKQAVDATKGHVYAKLGKLRGRLDPTVASEPLAVTFGLWLVAAGTVLQLLMSVCEMFAA